MANTAQHPPCVTRDVCAQSVGIVSISALRAFGETSPGKWGKEDFLPQQARRAAPSWDAFIPAAQPPREVSRNFTEERSTLREQDSAKLLTVSKRGASHGE